MRKRLQSNTYLIERHPEIQEYLSVYATYDIRAFTRKREDKEENEDCIAIEGYGIYQQETAYIEGQTQGQLKIALSDGVSAARPYAAIGAHTAVSAYFNGSSTEVINHEVLNCGGKTTLDALTMRGNLLQLTHVGDSMVYLVKKRKVIPLTFKHDMDSRYFIETNRVRRCSLLDNYLGKKDFDDWNTGRYCALLEDGDVLYVMSDGVQKLFWSKYFFYRRMKNKTLMKHVKMRKKLYDDTSLIEVRICLR